jgi:hypothetical protein
MSDFQSTTCLDEVVHVQFFPRDIKDVVAFSDKGDYRGTVVKSADFNDVVNVIPI